MPALKIYDIIIMSYEFSICKFTLLLCFCIISFPLSLVSHSGRTFLHVVAVSVTNSKIHRLVEGSHVYFNVINKN